MHDDHLRRGLAVAMAVAGVAHFLSPTPFTQHLPEWVPARRGVVLASGAVEVLLALTLLGPRAGHKRAGQALAAYLLAVWPANIYVAVTGVEVNGLPSGAARWLRLPLQIPLIWLALRSTRNASPTMSPASSPPATA